MDLITSFANEFNIPIIRKDQKIWFFRTRGGKFYYDFINNKFIALGWDLIPSELITDTQKGKEVKKAQVEKLYPQEKRPGLIFGQMDVFYNRMSVGDLVLIPDEGTKTVAIGVIGDFIEELHRKPNDGEHAQCTFVHRRSVVWKKEIDAWQDIYLFKALRAQQTISDITDEGKLIFRNLYPVYISGDSVHLTFQKATTSNLNLASNLELLSNLVQITDLTASLYGKSSFKQDLAMKTAVGSPGFWEIILPRIPVSLLAVVYIVKSLIGQTEGASGQKETGLMAVASKINELINDHQRRKQMSAETNLTNANTKLVEAQVAKTEAETQLIMSQTAKANAEARRLEMENEQIALLPSGQTTEAARIEGEQLVVPNAETAAECVRVIESCGCKICNAAKENGLSFNGENIGKVG